MTRIWWVEDFLSGAVLDNQHYITHKEAVDKRNELGFGIVKYADLQDRAGCPMAAKCSGCG